MIRITCNWIWCWSQKIKIKIKRYHVFHTESVSLFDALCSAGAMLGNNTKREDLEKHGQGFYISRSAGKKKVTFYHTCFLFLYYGSGIWTVSFCFALLQILCSAWKDDGTAVFSGGCDKQAKMWPLLYGGQAVTIAKHDAPIKELAWIPEMNLLATGSYDKTLRYIFYFLLCHTSTSSGEVYFVSYIENGLWRY